jgi:hypothetical protein
VAVKYNGSGVFTETCGRQLVKSEDYAAFVGKLAALQTVDLRALDSRDKKICFFANLLNVMTAHYHLHNISLWADAEVCGDRCK